MGSSMARSFKSGDGHRMQSREFHGGAALLHTATILNATYLGLCQPAATVRLRH